MKDLRIIFMGTPEFSCGILETLIKHNYDVVACVTQMDKPVGRKQVLTPPPVKVMANNYGIPVIQVPKIRNEYQVVLDYKPDLIITCAYGQLIPSAILDYPKFGCINVHASLLPKYRGGAPIHYAVLNGDTETGITIMNMVNKMDAGNIISQASIAIDIKDTTSMMFDKLMVVGQKLLIDTLPLYLNGSIVSQVQNEDEVTFAYNITKEQEYIDFYQDVFKVYNHIRGLLNWPVGYTMIDGLKIKLYEADFEYAENVKAGYVYGLDAKGLKIGANNGFIYVTKLQVAGKSVQTYKEFMNGYKTKVEGKFIGEK